MSLATIIQPQKSLSVGPGHVNKHKNPLGDEQNKENEIPLAADLDSGTKEMAPTVDLDSWVGNVRRVITFKAVDKVWIRLSSRRIVKYPQAAVHNEISISQRVTDNPQVNLPKLFGIIHHHGSPCLLYDIHHRRDLSGLLKSRKRLTVVEARFVALEMISGLLHMHRMDLATDRLASITSRRPFFIYIDWKSAHNGVDSSNVMLDHKMDIQLIGFGRATMKRHTSSVYSPGHNEEIRAYKHKRRAAWAVWTKKERLENEGQGVDLHITSESSGDLDEE
ncbi:hypothetical protein BGX29_007517 [Mortierella sp. GBA35]|nr:hypothetical protein BGX29_007517 [Mortierella sp. GBA35]